MANKKGVSDSDTKISTESKETTESDENNKSPNHEIYEGITSFAYIGPAMPDGRLKSNTVLVGTYGQITEYYRDVIEQFPRTRRLFVPTEHLAESREKTKTSGNLLNRCFKEIEKAIAEAAKEQDSEERGEN